MYRVGELRRAPLALARRNSSQMASAYSYAVFRFGSVTRSETLSSVWTRRFDKFAAPSSPGLPEVVKLHPYVASRRHPSQDRVGHFPRQLDVKHVEQFRLGFEVREDRTMRNARPLGDCRRRRAQTQFGNEFRRSRQYRVASVGCTRALALTALLSIRSGIAPRQVKCCAWCREIAIVGRDAVCALTASEAGAHAPLAISSCELFLA